MRNIAEKTRTTRHEVRSSELRTTANGLRKTVTNNENGKRENSRAVYLARTARVAVWYRLAPNVYALLRKV